MSSRSRLTMAAVATASLLAALPAAAAVRDEHKFKLTLSAKTVKRSTGVTVSTDRTNYTAPAAGTRPLRVTKVVFSLPSGTKINTAAATACRLSVLQTQGTAGCKAGTSIGGGSAVAITGTALDPVAEQVSVYVTKRDRLAAVLTGLQTVVIPLRVNANRLTAALPRICLPPGTVANDCATGEVVLKTLNIKLKARTKGSRQLVRTPSSCPTSRKWTSRATYTFSNGDTDVQKSTSSCRR